MWVFLSSELLLFAGLFALYGAYRAMYTARLSYRRPAQHAVARHTNTAVLITSSLHGGAVDPRRAQQQSAAWPGLLVATIVLGLMFLVIKWFEYVIHLGEGSSPADYPNPERSDGAARSRFYTLYCFMTGAARAARDRGDRLMTLLRSWS